MNCLTNNYFRKNTAWHPNAGPLTDGKSPWNCVTWERVQLKRSHHPTRSPIVTRWQIVSRKTALHHVLEWSLGQIGGHSDPMNARAPSKRNRSLKGPVDLTRTVRDHLRLQRVNGDDQHHNMNTFMSSRHRSGLLPKLLLTACALTQEAASVVSVTPATKMSIPELAWCNASILPSVVFLG